MRNIVVIIAALAIAACSAETSPASTEPAARGPSETLSSIEAGPESLAGTAKFGVASAEVALAFDYEVAFDKSTTLDTGNIKRQIFVEALRADVEEVRASVIAAMARAGYLKSSSVPSQGGTRLQFEKSGHADVVVLVRPRLNTPPDGSGQTVPGIAHFSWVESL